MSAPFQSFLNGLRNLFGGQSNEPEASTPASSGTTTSQPQRDDIPDSPVVEAPVVNADEGVCTLPPDFEIPPETPLEDIPKAGGIAMSFDALAAASTGGGNDNPCVLTIRSNLNTVNLRSGPGTHFMPPVAETTGGAIFELIGGSEPDPDKKRWYAIRLDQGSAWVRADLVTLSNPCAQFTFIDESEVEAIEQEPTREERFALPTGAAISQGFHRNHPGFDMASETGTVLSAPADGVVIRQIPCTACKEGATNVFPTPGVGRCPQLDRRVDWGFGYGNFMILRFDYVDMPTPLRDEMDAHRLEGGFAYLLLAHLDSFAVSNGEEFIAGQKLGETGHTGCSSGPHLHFEVRIGNDENVDGRWGQQIKVHPNKIFATD